MQLDSKVVTRTALDSGFSSPSVETTVGVNPLGVVPIQRMLPHASAPSGSSPRGGTNTMGGVTGPIVKDKAASASKFSPTPVIKNSPRREGFTTRSVVFPSLHGSVITSFVLMILFPPFC